MCKRLSRREGVRRPPEWRAGANGREDERSSGHARLRLTYEVMPWVAGDDTAPGLCAHLVERRTPAGTKAPTGSSACLHESPKCGLTAQVLDVDVGAQTDVIAEVPAVVVGIEIEHDVVVVPEPVADVAVLVGRNPEIETVDFESVASAAAHPPDLLSADPASEASVLPRMIETQAGIVAWDDIVSDPGIVCGVHVRGRGMADRKSVV